MTLGKETFNLKDFLGVLVKEGENRDCCIFIANNCISCRISKWWKLIRPTYWYYVLWSSQSFSWRYSRLILNRQVCDCLHFSKLSVREEMYLPQSNITWQCFSFGWYLIVFSFQTTYLIKKTPLFGIERMKYINFNFMKSFGFLVVWAFPILANFGYFWQIQYYLSYG